MQLGSGPGQSGMNMETYLAKMFNHGATLVNIFSWGIGGEAHKNMSFRVVTEGEEALRAYRKFLKGDPLIEAKTDALTLMERLPPKIHKIQKELPAWMQKTGNKEAAALMQKMQEQLKAKNFEEAEKTADSILKLMGANAQSRRPSPAEAAASSGSSEKVERVKEGAQKWAASGRRSIGHPQDDAGEGRAATRRWQAHRSGSRTGSRARTARSAEGRCPGQGAPSHNRPTPPGSVWYTVGNLSVPLLARAWGSPIIELMRKSGRLQELMPKARMTDPEQHRAPIAVRSAHATDECPAI